MKSQAMELTPSAVSQLISHDAEDQQIIVQVFNISVTKTGRLSCMVSDGKFFLKAFINDDKIIKPNQSQNAIICVKSHGALKSSIGITKLKMIGEYPEKVGEPKDWNTCKQNNAKLQNNDTLKFKLEKLINTEKKQNIQMQAPITTPIKSEQYQFIDDLYIGLKRWSLLCRITRKSLKQSTKKGTKVLEIQLVDKSKKKIIGTFFGQCAPQFNDYLKQDSVYEISKGYIRQGNYNNSRNQMISPYNLVFDAKSSFSEVTDFNIIVKSQDTAITLGQVHRRHIFHQQYDIVAYICEVKQQNSYQKGDKTTRIKDVIVADPQAKITMAIKFWNWNNPIEKDLEGKVAIFSRFSMKQSKGSLFLSSSFNSAILTNHQHSMRRYEGSLDIENFKATTESRQRTLNAQENPAQFCYNMKQLQKKIQYMSSGDSIKSILNVWISRFAFSRKWAYDSCPKCNKSAEKYTKCAHCGNAIEETIQKFILGVQISDFCGSLWITAYDDFAKKIFYDLGKNAIPYLQGLEKDELSEASEKYAFQPYRLKIVTKRDEQGRVKHASSFSYDLADQKIAIDNIKLINQYLR